MTEFGKISEILIKMEQELDLFTKRISGVYFWERIRFYLHRELLVKKGVINPPSYEKRKLLDLDIKNKSIIIKNVIHNNIFSAQKKDLFVFGHGRRKLVENKNWWDIYIDAFIEKLGIPYIYVEPQYNKTHKLPPKTENLYYLDPVIYLGGLRNRIGLTAFYLTGNDESLINYIKSEIEKRFNVRIDIKRLILKSLRLRKSRLNLYVYILRRVSPAVAAVVVSYGKETFIEACKILKIPVVEFQHGVLNRYHFGYSYPGEDSKKITFPDYFLSFGNYWSNCIEYPIRQKKVISAGFPYLELEKKKYENVMKKPQILFLSQKTIGSKLSKIAVELSKNNNINFKICYKLHPFEYDNWKQNYPWLKDSKIRVIDKDIPSLYRLFAESEIQVGVQSTAIYEGLCFNLDTYIFALPGAEYMSDLIKGKFVSSVNSVGDLISKINNREETSKFNSTKFFKNNSIKNIKNFIKRIIYSKENSK